MSAYHWEARRKQHVLDQRRAKLENVTNTNVQPTGYSSDQLNNKENSKTKREKYCKHCTQGTYNPASTCDEDYSAKMKGRYDLPAVPDDACLTCLFKAFQLTLSFAFTLVTSQGTISCCLFQDWLADIPPGFLSCLQLLSLDP
ncbi:uncharacterized protein LOC143935726 isoform X2 [Lithobates pipiens]